MYNHYPTINEEINSSRFVYYYLALDFLATYVHASALQWKGMIEKNTTSQNNFTKEEEDEDEVDAVVDEGPDLSAKA